MLLEYGEGTDFQSQQPKLGWRSEDEKRELKKRTMQRGESSDGENTDDTNTGGKRPRGVKGDMSAAQKRKR